MQSIKHNVIFLTSKRQINILQNRYWGIFEWLRYLNQKTKINIFSDKDKLFNFESQETVKTRSQQLINLKQNEDDHEQYTLNLLDHSGVSLWISKDRYNGNPNYHNWDGGEIAFIYIKKNWKYKDKFIKLLNESCSLWTQYENGFFDWIYKLSDEEVQVKYQEITNEKEYHCHNCTNCMFYPSIDEMKDKINTLEIEFYDYKYDKFSLEFIVQNLFGANNV